MIKIKFPIPIIHFLVSNSNSIVEFRQNETFIQITSFKANILLIQDSNNENLWMRTFI